MISRNETLDNKSHTLFVIHANLQQPFSVTGINYGRNGSLWYIRLFMKKSEAIQD